MEQHTNNSNILSERENVLNIREQIENYIIHWKWFVFCFLICLFLAFAYLRYTVPEYKASSTILVKDERKGGIQSELSAFSDLGLMSNSKNNVDNEIEVIKSRTIIEKAIKHLGLNVTYFSEGRIKSVEKYKDSPVFCNFYEQEPDFYKNATSYKIVGLQVNNFQLLNDKGNSLGIFKYNSPITLKNSKLIVIKNQFYKTTDIDNFSLVVKINKIVNSIQFFKSKLVLLPLGKNSSVLELTFTDPIKERAEDFLDDIVRIYNEDAIEDKNYISKKTIDFIDNRIKLITIELSDVEKGEEGFKRSNNLIDIPLESGVYLQNTSDFEKLLIENGTETRIVNSLYDFAVNRAKGELMPLNIVPNDLTASTQINDYNNLILERNRIAKEGTNKSPILLNYNVKIDELNENIKQSLLRIKSSLAIKKSDLEKQLNLVDNRISKFPSQARELRNIERQQKIKEELYLYLLQKREETAITLAVTAPNSKVIDPAFATDTPISPNRLMIYLIAIGAGLGFPFLVLYLNQLLDTKLKTRLDIDKFITIPFIGDVTRSLKNNEIIVANDRSSTAESMRIVRTNLEFLLGEVPPNRAKTIFVTSTIPKEGKTFITVNLASTIALSGKRTLLLGLDIRNPQLNKYLESLAVGVTNYLSKPNENLDTYISKVDGFENFYVLAAGTIPPNPAELLMNDEKVTRMFEKLKSDFDYIIVDTAPVSLVTDTILIAKHADAFVYVARANYLEKNLLKIPEALYQDKKLPNMCLLLNDTVKNKRYGYGYSYGYSYGYTSLSKKDSLLTRIFNKIFKS